VVKVPLGNDGSGAGSPQLQRWGSSRLLVDPGHGWLWYAPIGVRFPGTGEGVQPDLVFVSRKRRGIVAPDEILTAVFAEEFQQPS